MYSAIYELQAKNHLNEEKQNKIKQNKNNLFIPKWVYSQLSLETSFVFLLILYPSVRAIVLKVSTLTAIYSNWLVVLHRSISIFNRYIDHKINNVLKYNSLHLSFSYCQNIPPHISFLQINYFRENHYKSWCWLV